MDTDMFDTVPDDLNPSKPFLLTSHHINARSLPDATAQVVYSSSFTLNEPQTTDAYSDTNDTALVPVQAISQYSGTIHTIPLVVSFDTMTDGTNRAMFNNITYNVPVVSISPRFCENSAVLTQ